MAKRLLIVDDEETLTFSLYQSFIISRNDYEIITAGSGEEALQRIREGQFDLVITDIFMPGISGLELLAQVKRQYPQIKFVIMTAYGTSDKQDEALQLGAEYYIEKPFEIKEIRELVMRLLN